ncbi:hypothetical protein HDU96_001146 [Phlyctochytrium bullatum]|nr:hypothetical protein HDU96_001146 [Phlyctochytrium bullatum]
MGNNQSSSTTAPVAPFPMLQKEEHIRPLVTVNTSFTTTAATSFPTPSTASSLGESMPKMDYPSEFDIWAAMH